MATANDLNISQAGIVTFDGTATFNGRTLIAGSGISIANGNGVSANPIITATGTPDPFEFVNITDDALSYHLGFITGDGNRPPPPADPDHPGLYTIATAVDPARAFYNNLTQFLISGGAYSVNWVINLVTLSTVPATYNAIIGLISDNLETDNPPQSGIYFSYTDTVNVGNWVINCAQGGVVTSTNTAVPASTNYVNLGFTTNAAATSVSFFIDGVLVGTIATNIPTDPLYAFAEFFSATNDTPAAIFDLFNMTIALNNSR